MISGLHIEWKMPGVDEGEALLERLSVAFERAGDELADFFKYIELTPLFEAEMRRQFDAEGGGASGPWDPLTPAYEKWKEKHFPGKTILRRSDDLFEALTNSASPLALRVTSSDSFNFGTDGVPYADVHQVGQHARPIFDFSTDFERDLAGASLEASREALRASGLTQFVEVP